jgi:hypothetical protein
MSRAESVQQLTPPSPLTLAHYSQAHNFTLDTFLTERLSGKREKGNSDMASARADFV